MTADASSGVHLNEDATLLSVIAGKPISSYVNGTGLKKIARSMPNTPAQIGRGMTVWSCTGAVDTDEKVLLKEVLSSFGKEIFVEDESFIDMSTSISGSGPAYIFLLMEAMIDAGVHMGFSRDTASTLVHHTLLGSTLYAMETGEHPAVLRNSVTSPAGTTASAIYELENGKFRTVIKDAICTYRTLLPFFLFGCMLFAHYLCFFLSLSRLILYHLLLCFHVGACYRRSLEMGGHSSNVGPGRPTAEAGVGALQDSMQEALEMVKHSVPAEPPSQEMVLDNDKENGSAK